MFEYIVFRASSSSTRFTYRKIGVLLKLKFRVSTDRSNMNPDSVKLTLQTLAYGNVMGLLAQEKAQASSSNNEEVDLDELMDYPELEKLHADRIAALKVVICTTTKQSFRRSDMGFKTVFSTPS
ncbi:hypothetical protein HanHA300_Chr11g0408811 [Helianthus annuus]|nr:hypothetical protein HanHA300_Chr11g0408811 [Helianthus annuus]KAJ0510069.1 hypothetical protein HanIR_Chr11g0536461 [Helianthus annuus]KAJ0518022.1 hypothetical protein HanHA89_Chr11g0432511 [Helianthus annuus]KAJ0686042.1 hypothetical protein HanLR1_Chr11g0410051 [Helianthus annuus]KAJ0689893.1 hypothetical protein HanOQP8_Chr11g0411451 [Helianthus annuus]